MNIYVILICITALLFISGILLGLYQEQLMNTTEKEHSEEKRIKKSGIDDLDDII